MKTTQISEYPVWYDLHKTSLSFYIYFIEGIGPVAGYILIGGITMHDPLVESTIAVCVSG